MQASSAITDSPPRRQLRLWHLFGWMAVAAVPLAIGIQMDGCLGVTAGMLAIAGWISWYRRSWGWIFAAGGLALVMALFLPPLIQPRTGVNRTRCMNNLKHIGMALQLYHHTHGTLPPAYVVDGEGRPLYSWRVLLLPYLEQKPLYAQFHLDEPWNSPHNLVLAKQMPSVFACPSHPRTPGRTITPYVAIVADDSLWPGETALTLQDVTDGPGNTLAVVEWPESDIVWTEPRDLTQKTLPRWWHPDAKALAGKHRHLGGVSVVMADCAVRFIEPSSLNGREMRALLTRAGREPAKDYAAFHP